MTPNERKWSSYFQALVEALDASVYVCSSQNRIQFVNRRLIDQLGRDPVGERCYRALYGQANRCPWCAEGQSPETFAPGRAHQDPETGRWYAHMAAPIRHGDGASSKMVLVWDVTANKRAEDALLESERRLSTLMNNLPGIVYRCRADDSFSMTFASQGSKRLLGYEPEELLGLGPNAFQRLVNPQDRKNMLKLVRETVAMKRPFSFIYRIRSAGGQEKWVWEQGEGVLDDHGQLVALEGFISDVTAYKEVELDLRKENLRLRSSISDRYRFGEIIGKSEAMQRVYDLILKAAASDASVIISGESGSGKELVARAIHSLSDRRSGNFVAVNCGAIPKELMEREFFGHLKGAFTGANADAAGVLDTADGGCLFLDEIGEIGQALQVKLLRVLDGVGYTPLGGIKLKKSNFRVIAATNRDLVQLVKEGRMREDFFYRIRILPIQIPPLRDRKGDVALLIDHFLSALDKGRAAYPHLPVRVREALENYHWPGNVRELQNVLQTYVTLGKLDLMGPVDAEVGDAWPPFQPAGRDGAGLRQSLEVVEKQFIREALERACWHRGRAAKLLQLNYKTLQRKMKAYGIKPS